LIKIIIPKSERVKRLVREYGTFDKELLMQAIEKIRQRLGGFAVKQAKESLDAGNISTVADLTLTYYDKAYNHQTADKVPIKIIEMRIEKDDPEKTATKLKSLSEELTQF
jgi:tRNA 2-selenouridine synthase